MDEILYVTSEDFQENYLDELNSYYFVPRGMQIEITPCGEIKIQDWRHE